MHPVQCTHTRSLRPIGWSRSHTVSDTERGRELRWMEPVASEVSGDGTTTIALPLLWRIEGYPQRPLGGSVALGSPRRAERRHDWPPARRLRLGLGRPRGGEGEERKGGLNVRENKAKEGRGRPDHASRKLVGVRACFGERLRSLRCLPCRLSVRTLLNFYPIALPNFWCYRAKIDGIAQYLINFSFDGSWCKWSWCNILSHRFVVADVRSSYCIVHPLSLASIMRDAIAYCIKIILMQYINCNN